MAALGAVGIVSVVLWGAARERRPDVYLLVVDTLRADHLGLYGYPRATSPRLDEFAASATVFAEVFAPSSWTLPSVGSVMTGTYPSMHGLRARLGAGSLTSLRPGAVSLAEVLREAGYRTAAIVTNAWLDHRTRLTRGFDEYRTLPLEASARRVNALSHELIMRSDPRPLFLYLHYMDVHGPYVRAPEGLELAPVPDAVSRTLDPRELESLPDYLRLPGVSDLDGYVDAYDRGIAGWDLAFGEWIAWLRRSGRFENAILAVVSDHGEELADHGGWNHGETLYQEQLAVPWILRIPGRAPRWVGDRVVSLIDVGPTILAALGLAIPPTMLGQDVLGDDIPEPRSLFAETEVGLGGVATDAILRAVRSGDRKLIVGPQGRLCFDLRRDPLERSPADQGAACSDPQELERFADSMALLGRQLGEPGRALLDEEDRQRLRALGYSP